MRQKILQKNENSNSKRSIYFAKVQISLASRTIFVCFLPHRIVSAWSQREIMRSKQSEENRIFLYFQSNTIIDNRVNMKLFHLDIYRVLICINRHCIIQCARAQVRNAIISFLRRFKHEYSFAYEFLVLFHRQTKEKNCLVKNDNGISQLVRGSCDSLLRKNWTIDYKLQSMSVQENIQISRIDRITVTYKKKSSTMNVTLFFVFSLALTLIAGVSIIIIIDTRHTNFKVHELRANSLNWFFSE